jgi:hypothetical protein
MAVQLHSDAEILHQKKERHVQQASHIHLLFLSKTLTADPKDENQTRN